VPVVERPAPQRRIRGALIGKFERAAERGLRARLDEQQLAIDHLEASVDRLRAIAGSVADDVPGLRRRLRDVRRTDAYDRARNETEPLVTVRIPTLNRSELLVERALPSIARQTYENFEVIVVGDGCTDDTAEKVEQFGDKRMRFVNLPFQFPYPSNPEDRWLVAGTQALNHGADLARGAWIATLGDDDEFEPHHLECLLDAARSSDSEMVYGKILEHRPPPLEDVVLAGYPPALGSFNFQVAIVLSALSFFEFNLKSWALDEPGDWNLCRRMLEAGVRIGYVDRVVAGYYPSRLFDPAKRGPRPANE
jgi:glycosyltransferase involved in cell wall biosynthesis